MAEAAVRRSALLFALDTTGGNETVYRVAAYLQELVRQLEAAPGLSSRARIDLLLGDGQGFQTVSPQTLLATANSLATRTATSGMSLPALLQHIRPLPFEGGGFHLFVLMTRDLIAGWEQAVAPLQAFVASVTGLCCGPYASPAVAQALSKEPGGTRVVNPLDTIRLQFNSIADWLIESFADPVIAQQPPEPPTTAAAPTSGPRWLVREPDDPTDPTPHTEAREREGLGGWQMVGASRRGKLHAHEGRYRDDAFALGQASGWNLLAVADGAGSCRLSRVGAHIGVEAALAGMAMAAQSAAVPPWSEHFAGDADQVRAIAEAGLQQALRAVQAEAQRRQIPVRDLSSTLLLLAHWPAPKPGIPHRLAAAQIGDGMLLQVSANDHYHLLGEASKGYYAGETTFLTNVSASDLAACTRAYALMDVQLVALMTDGIADDLFPPARQIPELLRGISANVVAAGDPAPALLELISYDRRDSADDRTIALLYRQGDR